MPMQVRIKKSNGKKRLIKKDSSEKNEYRQQGFRLNHNPGPEVIF
jgi:hypothetical protein